jgi:hypothetical protein
MFELTYEPFDVNGIMVAEVKRVSLDAGQNLDHYLSMYKIQSGNSPLVSAVGLKKVSGEQKEFNAGRGWLLKWEKMEKNSGNQGLAVIADPISLITETEDSLNRLMLLKTDKEGSVSYWSGFIWDKNGADYNSWKAYVDNFAQGLISPIQLSITPYSKSTK